MAMSNGDWPADMLIEILLKLPVKSTLRFKCVSKTWCILFKTPTFVSQHLNLSKKNNYLLAYRYSDQRDYAMHLFVYQTLVPYHDLHQHLPTHFTGWHARFCVDNGLFCLLNPTDSGITLWNPATRESRILPECNQNFPPNLRSRLRTLGFGLDPLSNDYKVIYFRSFYDRETKRRGRHHAIYRMSTDSWRVFEEEDVQLFKDLRVCPNHNNTCVNGVYYWQAYKLPNPEGLFDFKVLAFHLSTEVFQLIESPIPQGKLLPLHDGRISIWDTERIGRSNEIWVLNNEGHWSKLLKIDPCLEMFGFWKNGKVFVQSENGQFLLYDLHTKEFTDFGFKGLKNIMVYTYEESLVAINR
ncbi:hypothetical protein PTKIN_Ptkin13bG0192400 [Pterospermum kingtungense]